MFKYRLVGRFGLFIGVLVSACTGGQIGDVPGGARFGPAGDVPEIGNDVAPLVCPGARPDVSAQNGWQSSEASLPADGALRFELKARSTAANLDGIVAVGAEDIDDFAKAAIAVRFADNGLVDVRDGAFYSSDLAYPYDPGVWYSIAISADIDAETYDVEIGPCGEPRKTLIRDASFRENANVSGRLSEWAVWSSQAAPLEVSTPAWMNSEGCAPATCLSLGHACGTPQDGCGGSLICGVCGDGEMCSSGTCIDAPANAPPPPPASCTPTTCQSLGTECGQWGDGCGAILNCGSCNSGELCSAGFCIDVTPNAPPPPACTPASCQGLGAECGLQSDGCGGILSCGSCSGSETCTSGICIDNSPPPPSPAPPPTGTPYGHVVPADVGVTIGVGVAAPVPTAPYTGPNPVTASDTTIENVVVNGCLKIGNGSPIDNITIRNVIVNCNSHFALHLYNATNILVEYSHINNLSDGKVVYMENAWGAEFRKNEIQGGQDYFFSAEVVGDITVTDSYMHSNVGGCEAHADGFQWWPARNNGFFHITGNYFDPNNPQIGFTGVLFAGDEGQTVLMENNFIPLWGYYPIRWHGAGNKFTFRYNVYDQQYRTLLRTTSTTPCVANPAGVVLYEPRSEEIGGVYRCNRYEDGSFVEQQYISATAPLTHDITDCPTYP